MSGILRLESLTKGNTLKQGDKTPLKYRLFDADGEKLNVAGKSATVRLVYPDFLTIGYEMGGLTVAQDDTVTFTIDTIIPSRIYHVEIIVDDEFIFPSRADEAKFTVDKSSLGAESSIIEIVGKDVLIREVKSQVDTELQPLVTSLESAQQAETQRLSDEASRVSAEEQRKIDHANRSAEFAGKADKVVLRNMVTNGDFGQGLEYWTPSTGFTPEVINQQLVVPKVESAYYQLYQKTSPVVGNVYYMAVIIIENTGDSYLKLRMGSVPDDVGEGHIGLFSRRVEMPATNGNFIIQFHRDFEGALDNKVFFMDLTQIFGAGNEPTKNEMDELIEITGYIDGEYALNNKEMLDYLMKGIRENNELKDNSVGYMKIDPSYGSVNVLDKSDLRDNVFYRFNTIGEPIVIGTGSSWMGTQTPIPVKEGDVVCFNQAFQEGYFVGFDDDGIGRQLGPIVSTIGSAEIVVGPDVKWFHSAILKTSVDSAMITINNPMPSAYVSYGGDKKVLDWLELKNNSVTADKINPNFSESINILNPDILTKGRYRFGQIGEMIQGANGASWYGNLDPIPVKSGDVIRVNYAYMTTYFTGVNDSGITTQISPSVSPAGYAEITIEEGTTGMYTAVYMDNIETAMITIDEPMPSAYVSHEGDKKVLDWLEYRPSSVRLEHLSDNLKNALSTESSNWLGTNMITAGTSISWQDGKAYTSGTQQGQVAKGWQTIVKSKLGLESVTNIALSGRSMADGTANGTGMITGILARADYANYDLAVIEEGTNDAKLNVPAGEIKVPGSPDFDRETFCGAMQMGIEHILSHNPNITLILFTPLHRNNGGLNSYDSVNSVGMKLSDYRDLIFEIGELYGCKVVDLFAESGINLRTLSTDTLDGLHPNDNGYEKMGRVASNGINFA